MRRLRLHLVCWLVSPGNPLKATAGLPAVGARMAAARAAARHPRLVVSDLELRLGTRYTVATLRHLRRRFPATRFVWIMGADNLIQMPRWLGWQEIFHLVPIAIVDRPPYSLRATGGAAASRFARNRIPDRDIASVVGREPPAWAYLRTRQYAISSTVLRQAEDRYPGQ